MAKILVVDDSKSSLFYLKACLTSKGHNVQEASTKEEAVKVAENFKPEVLLTDWRLGGGENGLGVAQDLLKPIPDLRIIFMTGLPEEAFIDQAKKVPYIKILPKPFNLDQIVEGVEKCLSPQ